MRVTGRQRGWADGRLKKVVSAFAAGEGEGLFLLATERFDGPLPPACSYWRDFAARYLTALCHTPDGAAARVGADRRRPTRPNWRRWCRMSRRCKGPSMSARRRWSGVWEDLDGWVRGEVAAGGDGLSGFLKRRAPLWHQVGRVCFHLAENRRNEDYPFAFLATYAPGIAGGARVQYQPLSRALQEFAGAKNKQALVRLLAPVHLASAAEHAGQGIGRLGRHLPAVGLDAPRGLPLPEGRAAVRGERRSGAAARLVEETSPAARRRHHRRCEAEEVRRRRRCSISRCNWPWATRSSPRPNGAN